MQLESTLLRSASTHQVIELRKRTGHLRGRKKNSARSGDSHFLLKHRTVKGQAFHLRRPRRSDSALGIAMERSVAAEVEIIDVECPQKKGRK